MLWPESVTNFIATGGIPNYHIACVITPTERSTKQPITVGYWTGEEDIQISLGGVSQNLIATHGSLTAPNPAYEVGTTIRTQDVSLAGLTTTAEDLIKAYELRFAPISLWQLCFTQGQIFKGARRLFSGVVDAQSLQIGQKGSGATLTLTLASSARGGTEALPLKKSNQSYELRGGDTSMEYAVLTSADTDWWGVKND